MKRELVIHYRKKAEKFFAKNSHILSKNDTDHLIIKAVKKVYGHEEINIDLKKMVSMEHYYRIRKGDIRIVFSLTDTEEIIISIVEEIGHRGRIYKK
jgi:mRNA-degrading endonuclease RelE of RelBE toxin-antitoxin system